jgi:hypothetical protein
MCTPLGGHGFTLNTVSCSYSNNGAADVDRFSGEVEINTSFVYLQDKCKTKHK